MGARLPDRGVTYRAAAIPWAWLDSLAMRGHIGSYALGLMRYGATSP